LAAFLGKRWRIQAIFIRYISRAKVSINLIKQKMVSDYTLNLTQALEDWRF